MTIPRNAVSVIEIAIGPVDEALPIPSPVSANSPVPSPEIPSPAVTDSATLFIISDAVLARDNRVFDTEDSADVTRLNFLFKKYYAIWTPLDVEVRSVPELLLLV